MTKTRRTLAVAAALLAVGGSLVGATSAMAADHTAQPAQPTVEVSAVAPDSSQSPTWIDTEPAPGSSKSSTWIDTEPAPQDTEDAGGSTWIDGVGTPEYLDLLKTDEDVDAAQIQLVDFMKARGLQVQLSHGDEDGRPYAEYDTFVDANLDAVDAYWDARLAQAKAQG